MAYVQGDPVLVDSTGNGLFTVTDLWVTPGGGYQVVWDLSATDPAAGASLHQTSYRIFDATGRPLTDEIAAGSFLGGPVPVHLDQRITLDDGTTLQVNSVHATSSPATALVLQPLDAAGAPLGDPIFSTGFGSFLGGGIAQLPNRDIVFVGQSLSKTGQGQILTWVLDNTSPDLYPPVLTRIAGADGSPSAPAHGTIAVTFNDLIQLAPSAHIELKTAGGVLVDSFDASDARLEMLVSSIRITPAASLDPGAAYVLEFSPGSVRDPSGNAFAGGSFPFATAGAALPPGDTTAPSAVDFFPAAGSTMLPPDWSLGITFSENVKAGSGTITLQTAGGAVVQTFAAQSDPGIRFSGSSLIIDPAVDLQPGTTYTLVVGADAVRDLAGNAYPGVGGHSFTTTGVAPASDTTAPTAIDLFPAAGSTMLPPDWSLGITFSEEVRAGPGTITLRTAAGQIVQTFATASDPGIRFSGASLIIDPAADLQPGTSYQLVVDPDAVHDLAGNAYAGISGYFFTTADMQAVRAAHAEAALLVGVADPVSSLASTSGL